MVKFMLIIYFIQDIKQQIHHKMKERAHGIQKKSFIFQNLKSTFFPVFHLRGPKFSFCIGYQKLYSQLRQQIKDSIAPGDQDSVEFPSPTLSCPSGPGLLPSVFHMLRLLEQRRELLILGLFTPPRSTSLIIKNWIALSYLGKHRLNSSLVTEFKVFWWLDYVNQF